MAKLMFQMWAIQPRKCQRAYTQNISFATFFGANLTLISYIGTKFSMFWRPGMAQWWEHSLTTDVAWDWFPNLTQYVGWVCDWFLSLLWELFLRILWLSPLIKNQHFQIPIWSRFQWTNSHSYHFYYVSVSHWHGTKLALETNPFINYVRPVSNVELYMCRI